MSSFNTELSNNSASLNTSAAVNMTALEMLNAVPRDENIEFVELGHKYIIRTDKRAKYTSVTTWCHSHFPKFNADEVIKTMMAGKNWTPKNKYWGLSPSQIKADWNKNGADAAKAGTALHYNIECFMNQPLPLNAPHSHQSLLTIHSNNPTIHNDSPEWHQFIKFAQDHNYLTPYRTEWKIYDETLKLAGSIDMVYELEDGSLAIYDWKRCKDICKTNGFGKSAITECINYLPDTNFWHYSLQLNTYKTILEKCYGKVVSQMVLVRLYPDAPTYELIKVPVLINEMTALFDERLQNI